MDRERGVGGGWGGERRDKEKCSVSCEEYAKYNDPLYKILIPLAPSRADVLSLATALFMPQTKPLCSSLPAVGVTELCLDAN